MEIEYFVKPPHILKPGEMNDEEWHERWIEDRYDWYISLGKRPKTCASTSNRARSWHTTPSGPWIFSIASFPNAKTRKSSGTSLKASLTVRTST